MTLIVEDGSIVANANSYVASADADAYFALTNNTVWAALDASTKSAYLISAIRFMQQSYRTRWLGVRYSVNQVLDWPRWNVQQFDVAGGYGPLPRYYSVNFIPQEIKDAQCEIALRLADGQELNPDVDRLEKSFAVGSLKVDYDNTKSPITVFLGIELLLKPFFVSSGIMSKIVRS